MHLFTKQFAQKAILGMAAIATSALGPANAQCVPGMGSSPTRLASQTWPTSLVGDYTEFTNLLAARTGPSPAPAVPLRTLTNVATDGSNYIYVLDQSAQVPQGGPAIFQLSLRGTDLTGGYFYKPVYTAAPSGIFIAAGMLWAAGTGTVEPLPVSASLNGSSIPNAFPSALKFPPSVGNAVAATFDGQSVWFATTTGYLVNVRPPAQDADGRWVPGTYVGATLVAKTSLGSSLVFDGRNIWTSSGSAVLKFDPVANKIAGSATVPGIVSSLAYDGTYLWAGSTTNSATKFDPITFQSVTQLPVYGSKVFFDGTSIVGIDQSAGTISKVRACDAAFAGTSTFPAGAGQQVFTGSQYWIVRGSSTLSLR